MENIFETEIIKNLKLDIKEHEDYFKEQLILLEDEFDAKDNEIKELDNLLSEEKAKLQEHLDIDKAEIKKSKKQWKTRRKELKQVIKTLSHSLDELNYERHCVGLKIQENFKNSSSVKGELKSQADEIINTSNFNDQQRVNALEITPMATKVKILDKSFETQIQSRNPRIGMSFGTNFKPRIFVSSAATRKEKRVLVSKDQFDIRKKDNFEDRVQEISEMLEINNPFILYDALIFNMKKTQGSQYISEFIDK